MPKMEAIQKLREAFSDRTAGTRYIYDGHVSPWTSALM